MADPYVMPVQGDASGTPLPALLTDANGNPVLVAASGLTVNAVSASGVGNFGVGAARGFNAPSGSAGIAGVCPYVFNGATFDVTEGNMGFSALASGARAASGNTPDFTNISGAGAIVFVDITAVAGATPNMTVKLQSKDPVSGNYVDIPGAVTASLTAIGTYMLAVRPGITVVANQAIAQPVPRTFRLVYTIGGGTTSITFSLGLSFQR